MISGRPPPSPKSEHHPSVTVLMGEAKRGEKPVDVIIRKCRAMVAYAKSKGWSGPPYDPRILAGIFKIKVEEAAGIIDGDGCIFPRGGRLVIQYSPGKTEERRRFTICHELAHTCFTDCFETIHKQNGKEPQDVAFKKFEGLCDAGAAELLMPFEDFTADLQDTQVSFPKSLQLAARYKASIDATLKRVLDLHADAPCAAAFLTDRDVGDERALRGRLRVLYCWKSGSFGGFIPSGTLVPANSQSLPHACSGATPLSAAKETWWIGGKPRTYYVESLRLPVFADNPEYPLVVALLHARKPKIA
jgi:hypothetical protein